MRRLANWAGVTSCTTFVEITAMVSNKPPKAHGCGYIFNLNIVSDLQSPNLHD